MRAFWEARRKALSWGLAALLVLWALWYARPLDIYDLIGGETLGYLQISVFPQSEFPKVIYGNLTLTAGKPEMEAVLERLEEIRFHRNPLEVVLRFLPQGTRVTEVDPEKDYRIQFFAYGEEGRFLRGLSFDLTYWRDYRSLPLYVLHGQERGRALGAYLWELYQEEWHSFYR